MEIQLESLFLITSGPWDPVIQINCQGQRTSRAAYDPLREVHGYCIVARTRRLSCPPESIS